MYYCIMVGKLSVTYILSSEFIYIFLTHSACVMNLSS